MARDDAGDARLASIVPGAGDGWGTDLLLWAPLQARPAHCIRDDDGLHVSPSIGCSCGYYATLDVMGVRRAFLNHRTSFTRNRPLSLCVGTVKAWGVVIRHESGYRSQFAYPEQLTIMFSDAGSEGAIARQLADDYDVPVEVVDDDLAICWGTTYWDEIREREEVELVTPSWSDAGRKKGTDGSVIGG